MVSISGYGSFQVTSCVVLAKNRQTSENKNRKDYATEKWEQDVRDSLSKKKAATTGSNLSKQDRALVAVQLAEESEIRKRISLQQAKLKRGVELCVSLVASNTEKMQRHVGELAGLLLGSAFGEGSFLLDSRPFEVFMVSPAQTKTDEISCCRSN